MKKLFIILSIFGALTFAQEAKAQIDATINPIGLLFGNFSVSADFALSENLSVEGQLGYGSRKFDDGVGGDYKWSNIPVTAFGKYYFNPRNGADRFYGDVWLRFINRSYEWDDNTFGSNYDVTRFGLGFGLGYKVVSGGGFVFDIGLGAGRALIDKTKYEDSSGTSVDWPEIMFAGKLAIGYRFGGDK